MIKSIQVNSFNDWPISQLLINQYLANQFNDQVNSSQFKSIHSMTGQSQSIQGSVAAPRQARAGTSRPTAPRLLFPPHRPPPARPDPPHRRHALHPVVPAVRNALRPLLPAVRRRSPSPLGRSRRALRLAPTPLPLPHVGILVSRRGLAVARRPRPPAPPSGPLARPRPARRPWMPARTLTHPRCCSAGPRPLVRLTPHGPRSLGAGLWRARPRSTRTEQSARQRRGGRGPRERLLRTDCIAPPHAPARLRRHGPYGSNARAQRARRRHRRSVRISRSPVTPRVAAPAEPPAAPFRAPRPRRHRGARPSAGADAVGPAPRAGGDPPGRDHGPP